MINSLPTPGIQIWFYKDAPFDLKVHSNPRAEWLLVATQPFIEGLRQYLSRKGVVMESFSFDDGRMLCWGGPEIIPGGSATNKR
jgi:hypothetical protein